MHSVGTMVAFGLGMAAAAAIDHTGKVAKSSKVHNPSTASVTDDYMGPSAFMWPYDRTWSGDMDNTAPCGSSAGATKRTEFPLGRSPSLLRWESCRRANWMSFLCRRATCVNSDTSLV